MNTRKTLLPFVFVNLGLVLVLAASTGIANVTARPSALTSRPSHPEFASYAGLPAYDSGWEMITVRPDPIAMLFTHNLGGDPDSYHVDLECFDNTTLVLYDCTNDNFNVQAHWYALTDTTISVYVTNGTQPDGIRVRIYTDAPVYDSDWESFGARPDPIPMIFTHNMGGDIDSYRVYLECRDDTALGTYDCTNSNFNVQAHWYGLTATTVSAFIGNGSQPDAVRVRIYTDEPAYDSGWESFGVRPDPIPAHFTHNLGGSVHNYKVSLECRDNTTLGTYDCTNDNFNVQAHWFSLSPTTVSVFIENGSQPDAVRVRIWQIRTVYMPLILKVSE